jgi:5-methylcytosine-specific restriction protein B
VADLRALYEETKRRPDDEVWHKGFVEACERARNASEAQFRSAEFQQSLWEERDVSGIGPGSSVTVPGAYTDAAVVDALWRVREYDRSTEPRQLAQQLDADFKSIIEMVSPRFSPRRPLARLVRLFVTLRPEDLFCLMDWYRTIKVRQHVGAPSMSL